MEFKVKAVEVGEEKSTQEIERELLEKHEEKLNQEGAPDVEVLGKPLYQSKELGKENLTVNDIFSVTTGQILNPNTEVLYKGPKMRTFNLSFKMAPRNSKEAEQIKSIIHALKFATLPKFGGKGGEEWMEKNIAQMHDAARMLSETDNVFVSLISSGTSSQLASDLSLGFM